MPGRDTSGKPVVAWPGGAKFALWLSHDIDKIHDREFFYVLAALNHLRRLAGQGDGARMGQAARRLGRALLAPKPPERDFQTILEIEARHGFRSTFFLLHDLRRGRRGPRYRLDSPDLRRIVDRILGAGGEIGLHGGYYQLNRAEGYRAGREALRRELGVDAIGIRNHFLRFTGSETWRAQEAAGFQYDSTLGFSDRVGSRDGRMFPFFPAEGAGGRAMNLLELPLTVMDAALFARRALSGAEALETAWGAIEPVMAAGGLVTLLWHNDGFNEPEYREWQWTYERLLERLAAAGPWCATGGEINAWWRAKGLAGTTVGAVAPD